MVSILFVGEPFIVHNSTQFALIRGFHFFTIFIKTEYPLIEKDKKNSVYNIRRIKRER